MMYNMFKIKYTYFLILLTHLSFFSLSLAQDNKKFVVINEGVIGLSKFESEALNNFVIEELALMNGISPVKGSELEAVKYTGCLDDECLSSLSSQIKVENFLLWSLEKKNDKYKGVFTYFIISKDNDFKKRKIKRSNFSIKTTAIDEMILLFKMNIWKTLDIDPPKDKFTKLVKQKNKSNQKLILSAIVGLLVIASLFSDQGSSANEIEPFQIPPDWPNP
jgi:hypothetical protein